ncbi:glycyl-radical enzyme activating protein [Faecalicatena acetigenes]|uniref:Glycyl-radical enzyme activating protein n=1 Tax=Faecalicatena acetigenes TaxID=2981790 RepID=A0ABT2TAK9_9FIRM|nr:MULTISPECIES: glycyl-radical enzyme activating protein [Lachnospiraceae]MCU6747310.1 glycyl-radical enzyme activating protein [Faecalicatena acetigenes]SCH78935.1 4-hydroxyphenylacetate decarboxylase activating enzyme [uncultured Clostridium sp.]
MDKRTIPVSNIERFALHDGPGIRTTIFLQNCPLRCQWCANPEAQNAGRHLLFLEKKCVGCGRCEEYCPQNAIAVWEGKAHIYREKCIVCGKCEKVCPNDAMSVTGKEMTLEEIYDVVIRDQIYYQKTGGGLTFSGGEALLYPEEISALANRLQRKSIPTAVETCGHVPEENVKSVIEVLKLFLFDIKTVNEEKMKQYTGGELSVVLNNFRYIAERNPDKIIARVPVIPHLNHTIKEMQEIFRFLICNHVKRADLLPYHTLGITKYKQLGKKYPFSCKESVRPGELEKYKLMGEKMGLDITIGG